jgi:hypothetical protein
VWQGLLDLTAGTSFNVDLALLNSCLLEIKTAPPIQDIYTESSELWSRMRYALVYAERLERATGISQSAFLHELDEAMSFQWSGFESYERFKKSVRNNAEDKTLGVS